MVGFKKESRKLKELKGLREKQKQNVFQNSDDDYVVGLYNGLELAIAVMEGREPDFFVCNKEPKQIEAEEQKGRTCYSGVIRRDKL